MQTANQLFAEQSNECAQHAHHMVPTRSAEAIHLYLRERKPAAGSKIRGVVLFVHGATLPSILFDIPIPGRSWLDYCANSGWHAFALDIRGYGRSDKPLAMSADANANPPVSDIDDAVADIDSAVQFICDLTGTERICLVGGSWGTVTCGAFVERHGGDAIEKLVLYAPLYAARNDGWLDLVADPEKPECFNSGLGAYRLVTESALRSRWNADIVQSDFDRALPEQIFRAIWDDCVSADETSNERSPPSFRAPNGTFKDLHSVFSGTSLYDASKITCPALLLRGSDDATSTRFDALGLFDKLGTADKRYFEISNAGHFASAEARAADVFRAVQGFLDSPRPNSKELNT